MTNEEALELLQEFSETASNAARIATWAEAFLAYGGEATWDAVKSVSSVARHLGKLSADVERLVEQYDDITPF